jgi:hypothetical protein
VQASDDLQRAVDRRTRAASLFNLLAQSIDEGDGGLKLFGVSRNGQVASARAQID